MSNEEIDKTIEDATNRTMQVDNCLSVLERALFRLERRVKRLEAGKSLDGNTGKWEVVKISA
jgi:hypothetical protein